MKKILALALTLMLVLGMTAALATTAYTGSDGDGASITISNAAKGETYTVVKLFDATITDPAGTSIAYQGTIPDSLSTYFTKNASTGEITATAAAKNGDELSANAQAALKTWATAEAAKLPLETTVLSHVAEGGALQFTNLPYGYYVVLTTQGSGNVTVSSTNPNATVTDKNTTEPTLLKKVKNAAGEWVEVTAAEIGAPKEFKLDITTTNWHQPLNAAGEPTGDQKKVKQYVIGEDFATNKFELVSIDSVEVGTISEGVFTKFTTDGTITGKTSFPVTVDWVDNSGNSKYPNGAVIRIIYKAKLIDTADIDVGNADPDLRGNVNTADLDWHYTDDTPHFGEDHDHIEDTATVDTYAIGLLKVNNKGEVLGGATFELPFYVHKDANSNGDYVYAFETYPAGMSDADKANYTNQLTTPSSGQITVVGVLNTTYSVTEVAAPNGYNQLAAPISITATKISSETWTKVTERKWKIAEDGTIFDLETTTDKTTHEVTYTNNNVAATAAVAVNMTGSLLPETGGIGTTLFYVAGSILVLAAVIFLVTKRRMNANND